MLAWSLPAATPTTTLFWDVLQIRDLVDQVRVFAGPTGSALVSLLVVLAVSVATHGWIVPAVACLSLMAAVNVGITRTSLSTTIILAILSGRWTLIRTQRPRARFEVEAAAVPTS